MRLYCLVFVASLSLLLFDYSLLYAGGLHHDAAHATRAIMEGGMGGVPSPLWAVLSNTPLSGGFLYIFVYTFRSSHSFDIKRSFDERF